MFYHSCSLYLFFQFSSNVTLKNFPGISSPSFWMSTQSPAPDEALFRFFRNSRFNSLVSRVLFLVTLLYIYIYDIVLLIINNLFCNWINWIWMLDIYILFCFAWISKRFTKYINILTHCRRYIARVMHISSRRSRKNRT